MDTLRKLLTCHLLIITLSVTTLAQHSHVVERADLAAAVIEHASSREMDRAAIKEALGATEVQAVAARTGVDLDRLIDAVGTMDGPDLERAAAAARQVNEQLVGGQSTITFSTTTIIIVLLIVILLIVAID